MNFPAASPTNPQTANAGLEKATVVPYPSWGIQARLSQTADTSVKLDDFATSDYRRQSGTSIIAFVCDVRMNIPNPILISKAAEKKRTCFINHPDQKAPYIIRVLFDMW